MKKYIFFVRGWGGLMVAVLLLFASCNKPSKVEQYRAEKHVRDSVALVEQQRSLAFYRTQLEELMPKVDSLLPLFKYEKNDKYQDHGYYVTGRNGLRLLVRDDAQQLMAYRDGKRLSDEDLFKLTGKDRELYERAQHLQVVMSDINELETRIDRTEKMITNYEIRLDKYESDQIRK